MHDDLLPRTIDNHYRGRKAALWIFGLVATMKFMMSMGVIFNGATALREADGVPLDTYPPAAAQTIVALFALFGLSTLILSLLCALSIVRYRSLVPFLFAVLLAEHLGRKTILYFIPMIRTGNPPGFAINMVLLALIVVGLALSLSRRRNID